MKCEEAMERIRDRMTGDLDTGGLDALREHLAGCAGCAAEARAMQSLWDALGTPDAEVPSAALRQRFDRMLEQELAVERQGAIASATAGGMASAASNGAAVLSRPRTLRRGGARSLQRAAFGMALAAALAVALGAGIFIGSSTASKRGAEDLAQLRSEVHSLRSTVALALLSEPSASDRLNGVAYGRELQTQDGRVTDALFAALLADPNVNVRLAALDALREAASLPANRARLLQSITEQDSPLVQISAIDVLLESAAAPAAGGSPGGGSTARDAGSAAAAREGLARLAQDPALDEVVRGYLRDRLERSPR